VITYIDMDGVLADFYLGAHNWMGINVEGFPYSGWYWPKEINCNFKEFPIGFWANLPLCEDAGKWLEIAEGRIVIATSPSSEACLVGKSLWANKYFPNLEIIFIKEKWLLANDNRWLIDDSQKQIENFSEYGGTGILVPRPWNE